MEDVANDAKDGVVGAANDAKDGVLDAVDKVGDLAGKIKDEVEDAADGIADVVEDATMKIVEVVEEVVEEVSAVVLRATKAVVIEPRGCTPKKKPVGMVFGGCRVVPLRAARPSNTKCGGTSTRLALSLSTVMLPACMQVVR